MKRKILSILLTLAVVSSLGLVSALPVVAEGTIYYVATDGNDGNAGTTSETALATIQAAIDKAGSDATIQVAAGMYEAGFNISGKTNITITGASAESTIIEPSALIDTEVTHKYTANMQAVVFVNNSTDITIENITFKSTSATPGSGGADAIVFWNDSSGGLSNCVVQGIYEAISGAQTGQGIAVDAGADGNTELALTNVSINGTQKNAIDILDGNGSTSDNNGTINVTVTGGTITGKGPIETIAQNGIMLWNRGGGKIDVKVEGVTLSGFEYTGDNEACAILNYGDENSKLTVTDSTFTKNQVQVFDCTKSDLSSVFSLNTFDLAVLGEKTETHGEEPNKVDVTASVIFSYIQAAVAEAKNGDTIQVAAGTYDEGEITVAKELAIIGVADSNGEKPVIKGTLNFGSGANGSRLENLKFVAKTDIEGDNIVLTKVDGFSIVDCEFDGAVILEENPDNPPLKNRAVQISSSGNNNITIDNCKFYGGYYVTIQGYANNLTVKDCVIEGVKSGINLITGSNLTVKNTDISVIPQGEDNDTYCVRFASSSGTSNNMTIDGGTFTVADSDFTPAENVYHSAIVIRASAGGTLKANYLNLYGSVVNLSEVELDATNNWWGNASGPYNAEANPNGDANAISDNVNAVPWFTRNCETVLADNIAYIGGPAIELSKGWNIFSTPISLDPGADTWGEYLALGKGLNTGEDAAIWAFDSEEQEWVQQFSNFPIIPGKAYYIKMAEEDIAWCLYSPETTVPTVELSAGWNLVGLTANADMDAREALTSAYKVGGGLEGYSQVVSPSVGNQVSWIYLRDATEESDEMELGKGYWVFMQNPGTLAGFTFTPITLGGGGPDFFYYPNPK
jgi:hypothetical protein